MMLDLGAKNIHSDKEHVSTEVKDFIVLNKNQGFYSLPKGINLADRSLNCKYNPSSNFLH